MKKILILLTFSACAFSCKPRFDTVSPKIAPVTEAVFASGSADPKDAYMVTCLSDGYIVKSYVAEGDMVRANQVLFKLDNRQQHTQVNIARTNLEFASISAAANSPTLAQVKDQLEAARVKLENDSITYVRYRRLLTTNSVAKQDVDNAEANMKSSRSNYLAALENCRITQDRVKQDLATSRDQLKNAEEGNQYYDLLSIGAGKVYQVFKKTGDMVRRGEQVAQIGNPDSIVINLDVDEGTIAKVKLGQRVLVELNTEKNKNYEATVSKIYPHFNETTQSYKVEARFNAPVAGLIAGTQLQANIITNIKDKALLIPHICLSADNKVAVKRGEKYDTLKVETGIISDDWVEIVNGLTTSDLILKWK